MQYIKAYISEDEISEKNYTLVQQMDRREKKKKRTKPILILFERRINRLKAFTQSNPTHTYVHMQMYVFMYILDGQSR